MRGVTIQPPKIQFILPGAEEVLLAVNLRCRENWNLIY
jgi:hypothetical protein